MKKVSRFALAFAAIATIATTANGWLISPAAAQAIAINSAQTTYLEGTAGGAKRDSGCAGLIADKPNHQVKISQDTNLRFALEGAEDATLLILGDQNQRFCVQADKVSQGKAEIPGRWRRGTYDVFVGSRNRGRTSYKLTIEPVQ